MAAKNLLFQNSKQAGIEWTDADGRQGSIQAVSLVDPVGAPAGSVLERATNVILNDYGDTVAIKPKFLTKFGRNLAVSTTTATIGEFQGATLNETFVSTNLIDSISSSSASDTTQTIRIEGHTIDGSGNLTFTVQDAVLNGQTKVTLATPLARAIRAFVKPTGTFGSTPAALVGTVYIYDDTGGVAAGVPTVPAATKLLITAGGVQTQKCATSISQFDYWIITDFSTVISNAAKSSGFTTVRMEIRDVANGGAWRPLGRNFVAFPQTSGVERRFDPPLIVPKNHDWRAVAYTDAATTAIDADASGYLALVQV